LNLTAKKETKTTHEQQETTVLFIIPTSTQNFADKLGKSIRHRQINQREKSGSLPFKLPVRHEKLELNFPYLCGSRNGA
jgi:hypothetical protein